MQNKASSTRMAKDTRPPAIPPTIGPVLRVLSILGETVGVWLEDVVEKTLLRDLVTVVRGNVVSGGEVDVDDGVDDDVV
jgi:hypothetical protein